MPRQRKEAVQPHKSATKTKNITKKRIGATSQASVANGTSSGKQSLLEMTQKPKPQLRSKKKETILLSDSQNADVVDELAARESKQIIQSLQTYDLVGKSKTLIAKDQVEGPKTRLRA